MDHKQAALGYPRGPAPFRPNVLAFLAAGTLALAGCLAIVSSDVPAYVCKDTSPAACPSGLVCNVSIGACVSPCDPAACEASGGVCNGDGVRCDVVDSGSTSSGSTSSGSTSSGSTSSGSTSSSGDVPDARPQPDSTPDAPLFKSCTNDTECTGKVCASVLLIEGIDAAVTFCSKPCCGSASCAASEVCAPGRAGGNYCVPSVVLKRPIGTKVVGDTCSTADQCRSGVCTEDLDGATKHCSDACCRDADCGTNDWCARTLLTADRYAWQCSRKTTKGTGTSTTTCGGNDECRSQACVGSGAGVSKCKGPCCKDTDCGAGKVCGYFEFAGTIPLCLTTSAAAGSLGFNAACATDALCASGVCENNKCASICCTDADCGGDVCRPRKSGTPRLRCTPR
jgi:hypothetical protein